jgi:hypothetical protein
MFEAINNRYNLVNMNSLTIYTMMIYLSMTSKYLYFSNILMIKRYTSVNLKTLIN